MHLSVDLNKQNKQNFDNQNKVSATKLSVTTELIHNFNRDLSVNLRYENP